MHKLNLQVLTHPELEELLAKSEQVDIPANQILFEEGDAGDAMYLIQSGTIRILTTGEDGREIILAHRSVGEYIGEQALLEEHLRRNATAVAIEPSRLARIDRKSFQSFLHYRGNAAMRLRQAGTEQLRDKLVRQQKLFKSLAEMLKAECAGNGLQSEEFANGAVVFRQGDPGDRVFLISEGFVKIVQSQDGEEHLLARLGKGSCFGELALINRALRRATAIAEGYLKVFTLPSDAFLSAYSQSQVLRDSMECLRSFYDDLPVGGSFTVYGGKFMGKECITALHHSANGLSMSSTRVIGEPIFTAAYLEQDKGITLTWRAQTDSGYSRELLISRGRIVGVEGERQSRVGATLD